MRTQRLNENRMKMVLIVIGVLIGCAWGTGSACANEWVNDVEVTRLGTYQNNSIHYVWVSSGTVAECQVENPGNPTLFFSEKSEGGKSLMAVLMAAVLTKKKIDIQVNGCEIVEVYLR